MKRVWMLDIIKTIWTPASHDITKLIPVFACLVFKKLVKLQHLLPGDDVNSKLGQHLVHEAQVVVD